jgi:NADH-quinone oxidoreductase subunit E
MISPEEQIEIDKELQQYAHRQDACIDALRILQRHRGWISDETLQDIAAYLDMSQDKIEGIATFYNLIYRKPVGKHIVLFCESVSCWIKGCDAVKSQICKELGIKAGETTQDNEFTLLPVQCLGTCDHAPAFMIDNDLFYEVRSDQIGKILKDYRTNHHGNENGKTAHGEHQAG